jgi:hypothetical protein
LPVGGGGLLRTAPSSMTDAAAEEGEEEEEEGCSAAAALPAPFRRTPAVVCAEEYAAHVTEKAAMTRPAMIDAWFCTSKHAHFTR